MKRFKISDRENIRYTAAMLLIAVRTAKANLDAEFQISWNSYMSGLQYVQWFRKCLHEKINRESKQTGRKFSDEYQQNLKRDARLINDYANRIRRHGSNLLYTPELKKKYPHINTNRIED